MESNPLTSGACEEMMTTTDDNGDFCPTVQFLSIKKVNTNTTNASAPDRYRLIVSDGQYFLQAMLATQLNHYVDSETIGKYSIVRLDKFVVNVVQNKRLVIVLAITPINTPDEKIGEPEALEKVKPSAVASTSTANPPQAAAPAQQRQAAAPAQQPQRSTLAGREAAPPVIPIEGLSPYNNRWTIKARVTQKSEIKTWTNQKGDGKLFSIKLMDASGEIRATAFNAVVNELYDKIEEGKVYYISRGRVNLAKKKFSDVQHEYEISLERGTEIEPCPDGDNVPDVTYSFVELGDLENISKDSICDVIGIVKDVGEAGDITSKSTNKSITKRDITLVDRSGYSVRMTLWGKHAEQFSGAGHPVIACKGVKVGDFGGRSLSFYSSSSMTLNPDIPEAHKLRGWYDSSGASTNFQAQSNVPSGGGSSGTFNRNEFKTLRVVKDSGIGQSDNAEYFSSRVTVVHIKGDTIAYPACPTCHKKVIDSGDGWRCEKCERSYEKPEYRYLMGFAASDHTEQVWLQGFNEAGEALFGKKANEVMEIKADDTAAFDALIYKTIGKTFNVSCRAKQDTYNDQVRVRYGITKIQPLDYVTETKELLSTIYSYPGTDQ